MMLMALMTAVFLGAWPGSTMPCSPETRFTPPLWIVQRDFAVNERDDGFAVIGDGEVEFRAANRAGGERRAELHLGGALAGEEIGRAFFEVERGLFAGSGGRLDLERGEFVNAQHGQVGEAHRGAAAQAGPEPVADVQNLVCARGGPIHRTGGGRFDLAFHGQQNGVITRWRGGGNLGGTGSRQKQRGRENQNSQTRFNVFHGLIPARITN